MAELGRNPARIIPAWHDFVASRGGSAGEPIRGIGEPIWAGRSDDELVECHRHESLLNLAFADHDDFWLICPYDTEALPAEVIEAGSRAPTRCVGAGGDSGQRRLPVSRAGRRGVRGRALAAGIPAGRVRLHRSRPEHAAPVRADALHHRRPRPRPDCRPRCSPVRSWPPTASCMAAASGSCANGAERRDRVWEVRDSGQLRPPAAGTRRAEAVGSERPWTVAGQPGLPTWCRCAPPTRGSVVRLHMNVTA